jgi:hypothetical protein
MRKRRRAPGSTFADVLAQRVAGPSVAQERVWPSPSRDGLWVDADECRWRRRGTQTSVKRIEHLLSDPDVRVLLFYLGSVEEIPPARRDEMWARVRPYVTGRPAHGPRDRTDFDIAEFKNVERGSLLIIEESC